MNASYRDWTCLELIKKGEKLCEILWQEISAWDPFSHKIIGEPLMAAVDAFGVRMEDADNAIEDSVRQRALSDARAELRKTRRWLMRSAKRGVISAKVGQVALDELEVMLVKISLICTPIRRAA